MTREQVYQLVNNATQEALGSALLQEDLGNVVDVGTAVINASAVDNYVKSLVNHIGRVIFDDRVYRGGVPSVMMDSWEFGSVLEKIACDIPVATENETWELENGTSYDPNVFYQPTVYAKFFNKRVTFEIPMSFTEKQVKESFSNAGQLGAFVSMLYNAVDKSMTIKTDALVMRTINNMIGETVYNEYSTGAYGASSGIRAVNLLKLYNDAHSTATITAAKALQTPEFIRFASYTMGLYADRMTRISKLFNVGGKDRFTSADMLHVVLLSDFDRSAKTYLYDAENQYNTENIRLPKAETVPYWQGSGTSYAFSDVSKIYVTTSENHSVTLSGILGIMFDRDALGVACLDRRTTSAYNPKAEFYTNWAKFDAGYFNDLNEQFVVFFIADAS